MKFITLKSIQHHSLHTTVDTHTQWSSYPVHYGLLLLFQDGDGLKDVDGRSSKDHLRESQLPGFLTSGVHCDQRWQQLNNQMVPKSAIVPSHPIFQMQK